MIRCRSLLLLLLASSVFAIEIEFKNTDGQLRYIIEKNLTREEVPGEPIVVEDNGTVAFQFTKNGPKQLYPCQVGEDVYEYGQIFAQKDYFYSCHNRTGRIINNGSFSDTTWALINETIGKFYRIHGDLSLRYAEDVYVKDYFFEEMYKSVVEKLKNAEQPVDTNSTEDPRTSKVPDVNIRKVYGYIKNRAVAENKMPINETLLEEVNNITTSEIGKNYLVVPDPLVASIDAFLEKYSIEFQILPSSILVKSEAFLKLLLECSPKLIAHSANRKIDEQLLYSWIKKRFDSLITV